MQCVLAMRVIDALFGPFGNHWCTVQLRAFVFLGVALASLDCCSFSFLFWLLWVPCSFTQVQDRRVTLLQKRSTQFQGSAASTASYVRSLLCCCVRISWPLLYDAVRPPRWRGLGVGSVLLTYYDTDADSGVRVFAGTIAWALVTMMPQN